jgi:hypothetical protein
LDLSIGGLTNLNGGNCAATIIDNRLIIVDNLKTFVCTIGITNSTTTLFSSFDNPSEFAGRYVYTHNGKIYVAARTGKIYRIDGLPEPSVSLTNRVLSLDGSGDYVTIPSAADLQNLKEFTLEAWVYPQQGSQNNTILVNKSDNVAGNTARSYELQWVANADSAGPGNSVRFIVFLDNGNWTFVDAAAPENMWVHVAARYSSSQGICQVFTNGVLANTKTEANGNTLTGTSLRQTSLPVMFGRGDFSPYYYGHGFMDEVRIWTKARTAEEIYGSRFCRLTGTETNLAGYWTFDDGTANDLTGHGHDGSLVGNAQAVDIQGTDAVHAGECGAVLPRLPATANAVLVNGFVVDATISNGGTGYTNTPVVKIIGGGGTGAQAMAVVSNGVVTAIHIIAAGAGYTSQPVIVIAPPFIEQPLLGVKAMSLLTFTNLVPGTGYQLQVLKAGGWTNIGVVFTASNSTFDQYVSSPTAAKSYRLAVPPIPTQAYATAQIINGFVVGATVNGGGSGYVTNPAVIISGGGGANATATAQVNAGVVTGITITSAGIGYTNTPIVAIAPPPANALVPTVTLVMKLDLSRLAPYDNYQMEFCPALGVPWTILPAPFIPTSGTNTQYINVAGDTGFFRARHLP